MRILLGGHFKTVPRQHLLDLIESAVLIVAQRVSTITAADRIIVIEDGELVGMGTDAELRLSCPTYAEIVQSQIGEEEEVA